MGWPIVLALTCATFAALILIGRVGRGLWEMMGAVLLLGVAGYAWQGNPHLPGAPRAAKDSTPKFDEDMAAQRRALGGRFGQAAQWLTISDGMARSGDTQNAANVLVSGLKAFPKDADLWVGMGNALVAHAGGVFTPSAQYSYEQAMRLAPDGWSAPYFYGLALARNGQFDGARSLWKPLLARAPKDSDLARRLRGSLAQIDAIAGLEQAPAPGAEAPQ